MSKQYYRRTDIHKFPYVPSNWGIYGSEFKSGRPIFAARKIGENKYMCDICVFTKFIDRMSGRIITEENIIYDNRKILIKAGWDTGSTISCISSEFVMKYNISPKGIAQNVTVIDGKIKSNVYPVEILINNSLYMPVDASINPVIHSTGIDFLIGVDIISGCDFAISTDENNICFSLRYPSRGLIDFTK